MEGDIIRAENLTKDYTMGATIVHALRNVNLTIRDGEFMSIMGPSGSGKTTLLNLLGALDRPTQGRVFLDGIDLTQVPEGRLYAIRRNKIGFIFQHFYLVPTLSALENILVPVIPVKNNQRFTQRAHELLATVGLAERTAHKPHQLSGGEQQRVAICRALINHPKVLFCDEITGEVDTVTGEKIIALLRQINAEDAVTVILVTHDPTVSSRSDRIVTLIDGTITGTHHPSSIS